jgi:glycosyltransferase involved in cell wall biosynthesis
MRRDVERFYRALDLYVLASHREGYPRSAMEAAAMGLPIVATNIRGCRQVVDDGRTGVLVPVDDAHGLARALLRLSREGELRRQMGVASATKAREQFDQRQVISTTLAVYERLLGRATVRAAK